jgi:hypothetical protein
MARVYDNQEYPATHKFTVGNEALARTAAEGTDLP